MFRSAPLFRSIAARAAALTGAALASTAAVVAASPAVGAATPAPPSTAASAALLHTDAATGLTFPAQHAESLTIVGSGARYKYGIAKVYAIALYVPPSDVRRFASGEAALDALDRGVLPATLTIKLYRAVGSREFGDALKDAIAPRIRARSARDGLDAAADLERLSEMGARLTAVLGTTMPPGTVLSFSKLGASDFTVTANGGAEPVVRFADAPLLAAGFFSTYIDSAAPLIPAARAQWVAGIEALRASALVG